MRGFLHSSLKTVMKACVLSVCDGEPVGGWGASALLPTLPSFIHGNLGFSSINAIRVSTCFCFWSASQGVQVIITCVCHCCTPEKVLALFKLIEWKTMTSLSPVHSHCLQLKQLAFMIQVSFESQQHCSRWLWCLRSDSAVVVKSRLGESFLFRRSSLLTCWKAWPVIPDAQKCSLALV